MADILRPEPSQPGASADPDAAGTGEPTGLEVRVSEATVVVVDDETVG
jgi:hypothetical protein